MRRENLEKVLANAKISVQSSLGKIWKSVTHARCLVALNLMGLLWCMICFLFSLIGFRVLWIQIRLFACYQKYVLSVGFVSRCNRLSRRTGSNWSVRSTWFSRSGWRLWFSRRARTAWLYRTTRVTGISRYESHLQVQHSFLQLIEAAISSKWRRYTGVQFVSATIHIGHDVLLPTGPRPSTKSAKVDFRRNVWPMA